MRISDPFTDFVAQHPGEGKPFFYYKQNRKTWHVHWGDGTLVRYIDFASHLDSGTICAQLQEWFDESRPRLSYKSTLVTGGVHGAWTYCPADIAARVVQLVRTLFARALEASYRDGRPNPRPDGAESTREDAGEHMADCAPERRLTILSQSR